MTRALLFALCLPCLTPLAGAPAAAQSIEVIEAGLCIERLVGPGGVGRGIADGTPVRAIYIELCDGRWARIADDGRSEPMDPPRMPPAPDDRERLPDAQVTRGSGAIAAAWLIAPTQRYRHGVLGDAVEAGGLRVQRRNGARLELRLGEDSVFEDLRVRLAQLDGGGPEELIVVRSRLDRGAALAVYGLGRDGLRALAESAPIGQAKRWLNPAGVADFDGDGRPEIAHVETPHIGGILRLSELRDGALQAEQALSGFSNHAIGSRELAMAAVLDWNGDGRADLALPDATRRRMTVVGIPGERLDLLAAWPHESEIATAVLAADFGGDGRPELIYGLANGRLVLATP